MAKQRKSSKRNSNKCPEPFNTLIDLAGGIAMNAVANKMEEKNHYRKRGVPNPYRATAFGIASGRLNKTEDLIRLGGFMGAMGAFDDDPYATPKPAKKAAPWQYDGLGSEIAKPRDNKYAWRLNCEDGSEYGIAPEDYETRDDYNEALREAKEGTIQDSTETIEQTSIGQQYNDKSSPVTSGGVIFCRVSLLSNGRTEYFRTNDPTIRCGEIVIVPTGDKTATGVVVSVEEFPSGSYPQPLEQTEEIIGRNNR